MAQSSASYFGRVGIKSPLIFPSHGAFLCKHSYCGWPYPCGDDKVQTKQAPDGQLAGGDGLPHYSGSPFQIVTLPSELPVASRLLSGLNATLRTRAGRRDERTSSRPSRTSVKTLSPSRTLGLVRPGRAAFRIEQDSRSEQKLAKDAKPLLASQASDDIADFLGAELSKLATPVGRGFF